jgi:hypothetical protein
MVMGQKRGGCGGARERAAPDKIDGKRGENSSSVREGTRVSDGIEGGLKGERGKMVELLARRTTRAC